jgi:glycine/D-amino acid oxidase-like deaminating enzyme
MLAPTGGRKSMPRVGVLGGGLQGCCVALELASRGISVVLVDENDALLTRTAVANEGKVHLGYMYAADPSMRTARTMMRGALAFLPFLRRHLGDDLVLETSVPAAYVVHRDSQHDVAAVAGYLGAVHDLVGEAAAVPGAAYLGGDVDAPLRRWRAGEVSEVFDPAHAVAVFDSPEVAVDPLALAARLHERIAAEPLIEVRTRHRVDEVKRDADDRFEVGGLAGGEEEWEDTFDQIVNALWAGRIAVDESLGRRPTRPWLHRLKYGVSMRWPGTLPKPPSATVISGPFGEVVSYADDTTYLTWYPSCVLGYSSEVSPPSTWETHPDDPLRAQVVQGTVEGLAHLVPGLARLTDEDLADTVVKGGVIVAWGETDVDDPASELHNRFAIGVTSQDGYHSVDPGKLTMAPFFAQRCADRVAAAYGRG